jgi:hypothetical protein
LCILERGSHICGGVQLYMCITWDLIGLVTFLFGLGN